MCLSQLKEAAAEEKTLPLKKMSPFLCLPPPPFPPFFLPADQDTALNSSGHMPAISAAMFPATMVTDETSEIPVAPRALMTFLPLLRAQVRKRKALSCRRRKLMENCVLGSYLKVHSDHT